MTIDQAYRFIQFVTNKEQRGDIPPAQFNLIAPLAQLELISNLLGNEELLSPSGVPPYGYKSNRKIDTLLRPLVTGPITITVDGSGNFSYPSDFLWPDAVHKADYTKIRIVDSDEYPEVKQSVIHPPTSDYPVIIFRSPQGYCDPINLGSFKMSYVAIPTDPYWNYSDVNNEPVYVASGSVDFALNPIAHLRICMKILQHIGINLDAMQVTQYAKLKESDGL